MSICGYRHTTVPNTADTIGDNSRVDDDDDGDKHERCRLLATGAMRSVPGRRVQVVR